MGYTSLLLKPDSLWSSPRVSWVLHAAPLDTSARLRTRKFTCCGHKVSLKCKVSSQSLSRLSSVPDSFPTRLLRSPPLAPRHARTNACHRCQPPPLRCGRARRAEKASEDVMRKSRGDTGVTTIVDLAEEAKLVCEGVKALSLHCEEAA